VRQRRQQVRQFDKAFVGLAVGFHSDAVHVTPVTFLPLIESAPIRNKG
jgi:hypothetical protein